MSNMIFHSAHSAMSSDASPEIVGHAGCAALGRVVGSEGVFGRLLGMSRSWNRVSGRLTAPRWSRPQDRAHAIGLFLDRITD